MSKSEVKPREWVLKEGRDSQWVSWGPWFGCGKEMRVIEFSAYQALQKENEELKNEIAKLKEYKAMYEGLCK